MIKSLVTTNSRSFTVIFFLESLNFYQLKLRRTQIPSNSKKKLFSLLRILRPKHSNEAQIFSPSKTITTNSGIRSENHCFLRNQNPNPNEYPPKLLKDLKTRKTTRHLPYLQRGELWDLLQIGISFSNWDSLSCRDRSNELKQIESDRKINTGLGVAHYTPRRWFHERQQRISNCLRNIAIFMHKLTNLTPPIIGSC